MCACLFMFTHNASAQKGNREVISHDAHNKVTTIKSGHLTCYTPLKKMADESGGFPARSPIQQLDFLNAYLTEEAASENLSKTVPDLTSACGSSSPISYCMYWLNCSCPTYMILK